MKKKAKQSAHDCNNLLHDINKKVKVDVLAFTFFFKKISILKEIHIFAKIIKDINKMIQEAINRYLLRTKQNSLFSQSCTFRYGWCLIRLHAFSCPCLERNSDTSSAPG